MSCFHVILLRTSIGRFIGLGNWVGWKVGSGVQRKLVSSSAKKGSMTFRLSVRNFELGLRILGSNMETYVSLCQIEVRKSKLNKFDWKKKTILFSASVTFSVATTCSTSTIGRLFVTVAKLSNYETISRSLKSCNQKM